MYKFLHIVPKSVMENIYRKTKKPFLRDNGDSSLRHNIILGSWILKV